MDFSEACEDGDQDQGQQKNVSFTRGAPGVLGGTSVESVEANVVGGGTALVYLSDC